MMHLLQVTSTPTSWELVVALAGVFSLFVTLISLGVVYGKLSTQVETIKTQLQALERKQSEAVPRSEVAVMFEDIKRRLERIEEEVTEQRRHG